jgi:glyoxylase-like metal-dependent hydrolase (beta-lactamase superfamily II)
VVPEAELHFWNDPGLAPNMPSGLFRQVAEGTFAHLERLNDRLRPVAAPGEAVPGIHFLPTPGHTPGHAAVAIESEGELILSTGDLVGDPIFSFERPHWRFGFDWDPDQGVATRRAFLDRAANERARVFGFHLPWPGFGHVARSGDAYRWIPEKWVWDP